MERQKKMFKELKEQFIKELVLAAPDLDKKIRIEVNASWGEYYQWSVKMDCGDQ